MRNQLLKLSRGHSTKAERRFGELLKSARIPFRTKVKIKGREVDFLVGRYAIEIDSHSQDVEKNLLLASERFIPIHLNNWEITPALLSWLKKLWQEHP